MIWSKYSNQCRNCNSSRRRHRSKGFCTKCYPYVHKIELSKKWDITNRKTLKGYPSSWILQRPDLFAKEKIRIPRQWQSHLDWLRYREVKLKGPILGIDVEHGLQRIADMCGVRKKSIFFGSAGWIDDLFDPKQKKQLFEWIDKIEQNVPWNGIN